MDPQPAWWAAKPKTLSKELRAAIRRVNQYALDRGIGTFYCENISVGRYPQDKDNPEFKDILCNKGHHSYYCWSRLDLHRKKARFIGGLFWCACLQRTPCSIAERDYRVLTHVPGLHSVITV